MGKSFTFFILLIASVCYLSTSAYEFDLDSNNEDSDVVYVENVPADSTDSVQVQPIDNIENVNAEQSSLHDIDTQGHENESVRKSRQLFGGGYYGGRGFYGGGFYPRPFYGGGGLYGRRYGGYGGYRGGFRYYG